MSRYTDKPENDSDVIDDEQKNLTIGPLAKINFAILGLILIGIILVPVFEYYKDYQKEKQYLAEQNRRDAFT